MPSVILLGLEQHAKQLGFQFLIDIIQYNQKTESKKINITGITDFNGTISASKRNPNFKISEEEILGVATTASKSIFYDNKVNNWYWKMVMTIVF
jgi:hypothetical protein